jgi:hypothetical protein
MSRPGVTAGLSVVATTRNDEHGGHLGARMQLFVDGLAEQAERFRFPLELILVEWNPPAERPPLLEALRWATTDYFRPQVITVPRELHQSYPHADGLPLFQMIGKNVGIRRSTAPYVLATNIDILLSDELFSYLQTSLRPNAMYRVDRCDVLAELGGPVLPSPAECRALPVLREHRIDGLRYPNGRPPMPKRAARLDRLAVRPAARELARVTSAAWDRLVLPKLHTSGCGDFTLASREIWFGMHGYPEWAAYSWHMDGVALFQAYSAGVEMINLEPPLVAYHLEHGEGSGWTPESNRLFDRLDAAGVPYLSTRAYRSMARRMVRGRRSFHPINGEDWGLAGRELATAEPAAARPSA